MKDELITRGNGDIKNGLPHVYESTKHWRLWSKTALEQFGWRVKDEPVAYTFNQLAMKYDLYDWVNCVPIRGKKAADRRLRSGFTAEMREHYVAQKPLNYRRDLITYGFCIEVVPSFVRRVDYHFRHFAAHPMAVAAHFTHHLSFQFIDDTAYNPVLSIVRIIQLAPQLMQHGLHYKSEGRAAQELGISRVELRQMMEDTFGEDWLGIGYRVDEMVHEHNGTMDLFYKRGHRGMPGDPGENHDAPKL